MHKGFKRFSLPIASALRGNLREGYTWRHLKSDLLAGITVGVVALPLAMALAIASGVAPQHGLYTAIVAGFIIAVTGGSRVNVSGPTAAFVVVLLPITHQYGLGGLLLATLMAGCLLIAMGVARLGRFIELVPYPVVIGFTAGIGVVIATLQVRDFLGLHIDVLEGHYLHKVVLLGSALPTLSWSDVMIGMTTLGVLLFWPKLSRAIPGHLVALTTGTLLAALAPLWLADFHVATIGSRFSWTLDGISSPGIPPVLPGVQWPWQFPGADGQPLVLSVELVGSLIGPAFAIAMLGAIESLLCVVVADGMTGNRHDANAELIGQGLGNIAAPFFGGIPATGAIARTATNVRAGAVSPLASAIHAITVLIAMLALAKLLAYVPMASLAALLLVVAWNMSEARHFVRVVRIAPASDVIVLLTCFGLTVLFDMVVAVTVGMGLAAVLFIKRVIDLTEGRFLERPLDGSHLKLQPTIAIYQINGSLFFGAAQKALATLRTIDRRKRILILDLSQVTVMDMSGLVALETLLENARRQHLSVILSGLLPRLSLKLRRAGIREHDHLIFAANLDEATCKARHLDSTSAATSHRPESNSATPAATKD